MGSEVIIIDINEKKFYLKRIKVILMHTTVMLEKEKNLKKYLIILEKSMEELIL